MKNIKCILAIPFFLLAACSQQEEIQENEAVTVSFSAKLPQRMGSRAATAPVNQVECAVFDKYGAEVSKLRQTIKITEGNSIEYAPQLAKNQTYKVVFWASNDGLYDVNKMTAITRAENPQNTAEAQFDAFTAYEEIKVDNALSKTITLDRPLARLNVGVTEDDWNAVKAFEQTPKVIKIKAKVPTTFNAFTGKVTEERKPVEYVIPITGDKTFEYGGVTYYHLAECFIMMGSAEKELSNVTFSIYADEACEKPIRENIAISNLSLQSNFNTNVLGRLMTATVTYEIQFDKEFQGSKDENIK